MGAVKDDTNGSYSYEVKVTNAAETVSKTIVVSYTGFKIRTQTQTPDHQSKIDQFIETDIKQWDGITPSSSVFPSSLADKPTFTLPSTYKGLSNFKVEVLGYYFKR